MAKAIPSGGSTMKLNLFTLIGLLCFVCSLMIFPATGKSIDLSENLLKVKLPNIFHQLGNNGFAVFDIGAKQLKFFNWQFEILQSMPLLIGEAPGEIKNRLQGVCTIGSNIFLIGLYEMKLNVYNKSGSYLKSLPMDIMPIAMIPNQDKLYIFNMRFSVKKESPVLCKVFSTRTNTFEKDITLKENLHLEKSYEGDVEMVGRSSRFAVTNDIIYLLNGSAGVLLALKKDGKVLSRTALPYPERTEFSKKDNVVTFNNLDTYMCLKTIGNDVYTCLSKNMGKNQKEGYMIYETHVIKFLARGKYSEKILPGEFVFIGDHEDTLYLFNMDDYFAESIKIRNW